MATYMSKVVKYLADPNGLCQQFKKMSFTNDLVARRVINLDGAGAVKVQSNSFTGASQAYDGYGSVSTAAANVIHKNTGWVTYQLDQKRYFALPLDQIETEESMNDVVSSINGLMKYTVNVELDKYRLSKLASEAGVTLNGAALSTGNIDNDILGNTTTPVAITTANIFNTLKTMIGYMAEQEVNSSNYLLYCTPDVANLIESASEFTHFIEVRNITNEGVNVTIRSVRTINGSADLVVIPGKYFCAFTNGVASATTDQAGTNLNTVGAVDTTFRMLLVAREAIDCIVKIDTARIIPNGRVAGFLGNLFELYIYHDIFTIKRYYGSGAADATTHLPTAGLAFNGVIKCKYEA